MPQVTLLYGAVLALLVAGLGINVTRLRFKLKVPAAGEPPKKLFFAIRAHGNATEWVPLLLVLLLLVELGGGNRTWLHVAGGLLVVSRTLHAIGFLTRLRTSPIGIGQTWGLTLWLSGWALRLHFGV